MSKDEIKEELKETTINLYNCTDEANVKSKLRQVLDLIVDL